MLILVVNCGSSSIKLDIVDTHSCAAVYSVLAEKLPGEPAITVNKTPVAYTGESRYQNVLEFVLQNIAASGIGMEAIGHRVVHGGPEFNQPVALNEKVLEILNTLVPFAPLHLPINIESIRKTMEIFPGILNVAVFDTAFHQSLPGRAQSYAIPKTLSDKYGIRRYGFHGTSHKFVAEKAAEFLQTDLKKLRIISCHLGNGASVCAIEFGRSVETSMGLTPLEGLVMGTRSGDVDPGILSFIQRQEHISVDEMENILYERSGLLGMSGLSNDMRELLQAAENGNTDSRTAIQVFCHRLKKYIGAYAAVMGDMDVLIFTGGIGENSPEIRNRVCQNMDLFGILLDEDKNNSTSLSNENKVSVISSENSRVHVLAVKTDEESAIAFETQKIAEEQHKVNTEKRIPIAISARHTHLTRETLDLLFGKGYQLTIKKPLSQPGQFAANETVTIIGPKNKIENVRILGPERSKDQVEIARTDEFFLGLDAPVRESGHTENTPGITMVGPKGMVHLKEGVICAWRHIHMHPDDAAEFCVKDQDIVSVDVDDPDRALTFHNVIIRVSDKFKLEMHIDTDEGNAAEVQPGETGELMLTTSEGYLVKRHV